jgi:hypothetical protein
MTESDSFSRADDLPPPPAAEPVAAPTEPVAEPAGVEPSGADPAGFESARRETSAFPPPPPTDGARPSAVPEARRRSGNAALWLAIALLFAMNLAAGGLAWLALNPDLRARLPGPLGFLGPKAVPGPAPVASRSDALAGTVGALSARMDALDRKLTELDADPGRAVAPAGDGTDLRAQVQALAQKLQGLDSTIQSTRAEPQAQDLSNQIGALNARLDQIAADQKKLAAEQQSAAEARQRVALGLAIGNLESALLTGRPYARELEAVRSLAPQGTDLSAQAETGAPTVADLAARFPSVADRAVQAERQAGTRGWLGRLWARLRTLVVIRPVGDVAGTSTEAVLARAQARLDRGDLDGAVREASALQGPAAATVAPWLANARARLAAEAEAASLRDRLIGDLARRG